MSASMDDNFQPRLDEGLFDPGAGHDLNDADHFGVTTESPFSEGQDDTDHHGELGQHLVLRQHAGSEHYTGFQPYFSLNPYDGAVQQDIHVQHAGLNSSNGFQPLAGPVHYAGLENSTGLNSNSVLEPQATPEHYDELALEDQDGLEPFDGLSLESNDREDFTDDEASNLGTLIQQDVSKPKRQQKAKNHGELSEDANGNLIFKDPKGNELPATYLTKEVREEILTEMARLGTYKYDRRDGRGEYDRTCYHADQTNWGKAREDWPDILYQHNKPEPPKKRKRVETPGYMMHHNKVVIDSQSKKPLRDFPHIPKILSSKEEGWLLEALYRLDNRVKLGDFRDRMPYWGRPNTKDLSMYRSRFRWRSGLKSWTTRSASDKINQYLDSVVPKECQEANSTRGWKGLKKHEEAKIKELSKGEFPERARRARRAMQAEGAVTETERPIRAIRQRRTGNNRAASTASTVPFSAADQSANSSTTARTAHTATTSVDGETGTSQSPEPHANNYLPYGTVHSDQPGPQHGTYAGSPYGQAYYPAADFRNKDPACQVEQRLIQRALAPTRRLIEQHLNIVTRPTDLRASYLSQWNALYRHFHAQLSASLHRPACPGDIGRHGTWMYAFPDVLYQDVDELPATAGDQI